MIAICPNPFRDHELKLTREIETVLQQAGFDTAVCPVFSEDEPEMLPQDLRYLPLQSCADCSLAVVVGGDGTILAVSRALRGREIPILGVNLGTKGFLANLEPDEIGYAVPAARGELRISRRMMLAVSLRRDGEILYTDHALNDAVVHGYGDCVQLTAYCDSDKIVSYSGDGIILSTPTGSTGYSMSAGGPIVEPEAANIILSPICAHRMGSRSFVLDSGRTVIVKAERLHSRRAYLSVDGISVADLQNGDELLVAKSEYVTLMADPGTRSFFEIAYDKLM